MIPRPMPKDIELTEGPALAATVRELVADRLGVDARRLSTDVSLRDDLAVDSLDLAEIAIAIESELGVVLPRRFLDDVRSVGDLIDATLRHTRSWRRDRHAHHPVPLHARITPAGPSPTWTVERVLLLTPYAAEMLSDDAGRAGAGGRLELVLGADATFDTVAWVERRFEELAARGIAVEVHRDPRVRRASAA
ncbi:MAG TPA: acyl carrier protein [Candidatus Binatia bacterium]|nr:acyl carrier protein [Candidatus Binatia bacterium]